MTLAAPFAEFFVLTKLIVSGNIEQTVLNIAANRGLLAGAICAYLTVYVCDVLVAWALYVLLAPVDRPLALLTAWFRLV